MLRLKGMSMPVLTSTDAAAVARDTQSTTTETEAERRERVRVAFDARLAVLRAKVPFRGSIAHDGFEVYPNELVLDALARYEDARRRGDALTERVTRAESDEERYELIKQRAAVRAEVAEVEREFAHELMLCLHLGLSVDAEYGDHEG